MFADVVKRLRELKNNVALEAADCIEDLTALLEMETEKNKLLMGIIDEVKVGLKLLRSRNRG
jgi:hypothetical protein